LKDDTRLYIFVLSINSYIYNHIF